ncbi:hypothetical protein AKJ62_00750 [candidate division MSBL1 archaeon SCGC-AAA259D14]|uniref:Uncharacterized protein n=2 Tax=candidate division MSBL1 TaxID=215777 RepID=A0A133U8C4_9EURY|nr:hypothetical protein AKJ62_00750 [candidate division MSBL1 archaeon SCGC-AAA259D14]KXA93260.1 hypothetical protein AKJ66_02480 [candidate division MSBL1 archaeon SCGC-AAA259E22]
MDSLPMHLHPHPKLPKLTHHKVLQKTRTQKAEKASKDRGSSKTSQSHFLDVEARGRIPPRRLRSSHIKLKRELGLNLGFVLRI